MNLQEYIDELKGTERFKQVGIFSLDQHEYSFSDLKFGNKYVMDTILACSSDPSSFFTNGIYLEKDESGNPINKVSVKNVCFFIMCARASLPPFTNWFIFCASFSTKLFAAKKETFLRMATTLVSPSYDLTNTFCLAFSTHP